MHTETHPAVYRIRVAVPVKLFQSFDYLVDESQYQRARVGARVSVPFGRQNLVGIVSEVLPEHTALDAGIQLRAIHDLLDEDAIIHPLVFNLLTWASQYYHFPIGEVFEAALPALLRQGKPLDLLTYAWRLTPQPTAPVFKQAVRQKEAYQILKLHPKGTSETILNMAGVETAILKKLQQKGLAEQYQEKIDFRPTPVTLAQMPLTANEDQQTAIREILKAKQYRAFLLDGLTGSGKTEVYLQVMHEVLKQNKQVLVLVPEIGLTPQTIHRFKARFQAHIVLMHSGLTETQRLKAWHEAQTGQADIVIGTRSAVFSSLPRLGLIILDEEHDLSFKQQEQFRYHARDVALKRAHLQQCPIILGSATPSLESIALVASKKMTHLQLRQRAGNAHMPHMHLIDLKGHKKHAGLSEPLIEKIKAALERQEQVLVFLNRRGYAPVYLCESCGWQADCSRCDAHLTVHQHPYAYLHCHHCGWMQNIMSACPSCQSTELKTLGVGTAQVEDMLHQLFPQTAILRVDRDTTQKVGRWEAIYEQILQPKAAILLGTQMLAKGHHFPYVTLVAILDIDSGLLSVDLRAPERTAQLIVQVAGRAGRGEHKGHVYLQTYRPDHLMLTTLLQHGYAAFAEHTLQERQAALLPPCRYSALVRAESRDPQYSKDFLEFIAEQLKQHSQNDLDIWGPIPAPMEKRAGFTRAHLVLLCSDRAKLHYYLNDWWTYVMALPRKHQLRLSLDVDPQEFS